MSEIITVGLDLAKNVFQAHIDAAGGRPPHRLRTNEVTNRSRPDVAAISHLAATAAI